MIDWILIILGLKSKHSFCRAHAKIFAINEWSPLKSSPRGTNSSCWIPKFVYVVFFFSSLAFAMFSSFVFAICNMESTNRIRQRFFFSLLVTNWCLYRFEIHDAVNSALKSRVLINLWWHTNKNPIVDYLSSGEFSFTNEILIY